MTATHHHVALWLDHREAKIVHFNANEAQEVTIHSPSHGQHLHSKAGSAAGTHHRTDDTYFHDVAQAIGMGKAVLLTGPADAKTEFMKYVERHLPDLAKRVDAVETSGKLTLGQLTAHARQHFKLADRMTPQISS